MKLDAKACLIAAAWAIDADETEAAQDHLDDYAMLRIDLRMAPGQDEPTIHGVDVWDTGLIGSKNMTFDGDSFFGFLNEIL